MRFLREVVVIYRFLSAIKALMTVISWSLLPDAVLMATFKIQLGREGVHSVPLVDGLQIQPGWLSITVGFGAARRQTEMQPAVPQSRRIP